MPAAGNAAVSSSEVMSVNVWLTWTVTPGASLWQGAAPLARPRAWAAVGGGGGGGDGEAEAGAGGPGQQRVAGGQVSDEVDVKLDDACLHGAAPEGQFRQVGAVGQGPAAAPEPPGRRGAHHEVRAGARDVQQPFIGGEPPVAQEDHAGSQGGQELVSEVLLGDGVAAECDRDLGARPDIGQRKT